MVKPPAWLLMFSQIQSWLQGSLTLGRKLGFEYIGIAWLLVSTFWKVSWCLKDWWVDH